MNNSQVRNVSRFTVFLVVQVENIPTPIYMRIIANYSNPKEGQWYGRHIDTGMQDKLCRDILQKQNRGKVGCFL